MFDALGRVLARRCGFALQRAAARQLGDGRLCFARQLTCQPDGPTASCNVVGTALAGKAWQGSGRGRPVREDHDRRRHAGRLDTVVPQEFVPQASERRRSPFRPALLRPATTAACAAKTWRRAARRCTRASCSRPAAWAGWPRWALPKCRCGAAARGLFFHRRRNPVAGRGAARRRGVRQQPLHRVRPAHPPGLRGHRHGRGARRAGAAGSRLTQRRQADAIITSGGVSVGEADHTKAMMKKLGDVAFWRIAMRPGRPMAVGRIASTRPQRRAVRPARQSGGGDGDLLAFVRPALLRMMGASRHRRRCCRRAARKPSAKSRAAPNTSAASYAAGTARRRSKPPAARARACCARWPRPTG